MSMRVLNHIWTAPDGTLHLDREFGATIRAQYGGPHAAFRELVPISRGERLMPYATWRKAFRGGAVSREVLDKIAAWCSVTNL